MGLMSKIGRPNSIRSMLYTFLASLAFSTFSGCSNKDSNPTSPNPPGGGQDTTGRDTSYFEDRGYTNDYGDLELNVEGKRFDFKIMGEHWEGLEGIVVDGANYGSGIYGFSFEDFSYNHFSGVLYYDINNTNMPSRYDSISIIDVFSINKFLNEVRGRDYEISYLDTTDTYIYRLSDNPRLTFKETNTIDDLRSIYMRYDIINQNISFLEFLTNNSGSPAMGVALKAAKFRQYIVENLNNYNDMVSSFVDLFGVNVEFEALYIDVWQNRLNVITHAPSEEEFVTLKGFVYNRENNIRINRAGVEVIGGLTDTTLFTNSSGEYILKFLREGDYFFRVNADDFNTTQQNNHLTFYGYAHPQCNHINFGLTPEVTEPTLDTLIIPLYPDDVDDAMVLLNETYSSSGYFRQNDNDNFGNVANFDVSNTDNFQEDPRYLFTSRFFIKPHNLHFDSNTISIYLGLWARNYYVPQMTIQVLRSSNVFNENTLAWNNQPGLGSVITTLTPTNQSFGRVYFDITSFARGVYNGNYSNYGLVFKDVNEEENRVYRVFDGYTSEMRDERVPSLMVIRRVN